MTHGHPRLAIHRGVAIHLSGHQHFLQAKRKTTAKKAERKKEKELQ
jgi:hypothetical protein